MRVDVTFGIEGSHVVIRFWFVKVFGVSLCLLQHMAYVNRNMYELCPMYLRSGLIVAALRGLDIGWY